MKVVRKEFFKQDRKVKENLEREIRVMKLLRGCEYVVHLHHVQVGQTSILSLDKMLCTHTHTHTHTHTQELKLHIVLVMELCEFDLDHLVKIKPFKEQDIVIFLHQLGEFSQPDQLIFLMTAVTSFSCLLI